MCPAKLLQLYVAIHTYMLGYTWDVAVHIIYSIPRRMQTKNELNKYTYDSYLNRLKILSFCYFKRM